MQSSVHLKANEEENRWSGTGERKGTSLIRMGKHTTRQIINDSGLNKPAALF